MSLPTVMRVCVLGCLTFLLLAANPPPALAGSFSVSSFSPWAGYAIPNGLWLVGDYNGDGKSDILHAVQNTDYVHVWISQGNGQFTVSTFRPWRGYAIPNGLWMVGDFNGDGKSDIAHAVQNTDYVHIWTSRGDGTFVVTSFSPWAGYAIPNGLWLPGDVNGDGKTDIVHAVQNKDYVHVWMSQGNGRFNVSTFRPWAGYAIPNGLWLIGDHNGDGRADIVHAVQNRDYVHVWISQGNGQFTVSTFRPWAGYAIPNGLWMVGDFNGDRKADIVHAVQNRDYVHVWTSRGNGTFSVGTFRPWVGYAIPNGLWLVGDYDKDGDADIVHAVQSTDYVHVWRSQRNGTFQVTTFSPWAGYAIPNGLWLPGDFTGDGRTDIVHAVQRTSYVHPWLSTLPAPGEVSLDGLEVTQVVQEVAHTVPLVADKATWVRAYLSYNSTTPLTVRGTLRVRRFPFFPAITVNSTNTVTINPAQNDQLRAKREDITLSLNFPLPAQVATSGRRRVDLQLVSNASTGAAVPCSDCGTSPVQAQWLTSASLRLRIIGLRYSMGTPPQNFAPQAIDFTLLNSWLRRAYPIAQLITSQTTVASTTTPAFTCGNANAQLATIRNNDVNGGTDARTHYYGLVSDGGFFMRGCAAGIPGNAAPATVASGPTGSGTWGWDNDGSYGDWYGGHELGHTLGRFHIGSGCGESNDDPNYPFPNGQLSAANGAFTGLESGDGGNNILSAALPGVPWHDVMSYCQRQWLSSYTYTRIRDRLTAEEALAPGAPAPGAPGAPGAAGGAAPAATAPQQARRVEAIQMKAHEPPAAKPALASAPAAQVGHRKAPVVVFGAESAEPLPSPALDKFEPQIVAAAMSETPEVPAPYYETLPDVQQGSVDAAWEPERAVLAAATIQGEVVTGDFVNVVATINVTKNTAKIQFVNRVSRALVPKSVVGNRAQVVFRDKDGKVLAEHSVDVLFDTDIPDEEDQTGLIDATVPFAPGTALVELVSGGKVVDSRRVSRNAPAVRNLRLPRLANRAALAERNVLRWEAADPDDDPLTYSVQLSFDDGRTWQTYAVGLTSPEWEIDPSVGEQKRVLFRVIANDGFNSTTLRSGVLAIPQQ